MSETNKTYRIKANVSGEYTENFIALDTNLVQDYDTLDILSIKIKSADTYRLHNSNYGVIVGRVLANNGFGIPNAKISVFIKSDSEDGELVKQLYPFSTTYTKDSDGVRYNLLPDEKTNDCHQIVGTFPNKRYMLDNDVVLEVFDKYYKYTTRTNNSGDYIIMGVPVGNQTLHMDLDLSDCGILSQRPRDFVYKGYTMEQFENPSLFKNGTNYPELSQIFSQDRVVNVIPFWGNDSLGESVGITRADIDVAFKFETTCVFIGSVVSDNASNGITKKCMATENMGNMEELTTGEGTIEMIRKTPTGAIESFAVRGNQLINGNGVWCYQIPMNLDYMMTDEYGNMVPTNDPDKGIPTRASVRFRISMQDNEENLDFFYRCKVLVPHNPQYTEDGQREPYDYEFGSLTKEESFRDLFWDNVYTVKSYIPRFQKKKVLGWRDKKFTGIKNCNFYGNNNPIPYNNIRIKLPFMFTIMCALVKCLIAIVMVFNAVLYHIGLIAAYMGNIKILGWRPFQRMYELSEGISLNVLSEGLCPDLENWFFAPITVRNIKVHKDYDVLQQTMAKVAGDNGFYDSKSVDYNNKESEDEVMCITTKRDYLIACIEMNLAMEYRVINFDFYNDWINGMIYVPRFMRYVKPKKTVGKKNGQIAKVKIKGCMDDTSIFARSRRYTQQCSIGYGEKVINKYTIFTTVANPLEKVDSIALTRINNLHKKRGFSQFSIFNKYGGICHEHKTSRKQNVYYMKPCEWQDYARVLLYATDIVLLGSLKTCDENGLPQAFKYLSSTSYVMPTNLALTNMETNGSLYANGKNTVCAGKSNQNMTHNTDDDKGVHPVDPNEGIVAELEAYEGSKDSNMDTQYEENELSDVVPLTEAAGIAWNYTGPGQGSEDMTKMFNPGGHFLGISCINSQTNLKSCVNLTRICEIGTTMSQRKEDIIDITGDGAPDYIYTAPSGFISGNDINGEDFRSMFSTMNQKRLKATRINNETGYYYYDLEYVKPLNFNGAFESVIDYANEKYNGKVDVKIDDEESLKKFGISKGLGYDFDVNEEMRTQTRTIEDASLDYYRFRFGLSYDDIKTNNKNKVRHKHKFLYTNESQKYMPQYENSYYFYFGLKAGATAIDEFNKQFFAACDTSVIGKNNPILTTNIEDIKLEEQTGDVNIILDNVEMPLMNVTYMRQIENGGWETYDVTSDWNQYYVITLNDLPFGKYRVEVIDFNGNRIDGNFSIGLDIFKYSVATYDFNVSDAMVYSSINNSFRNTNHIFIGGYIQIGNVDIGDSYVSDISSALTFIVTNSVLSASTESASTIYRVENNSVNPPKVDICVKSAYTNYNLYLHYDVMNGSTVKELDLNKSIFLESFQVKDGSKINLAMGWQGLPFYTIITASGNSKTITPVESAWTVDEKEYFEYIKEIDDVDLNFGGNGQWWTSPNLPNDNSGTTVGNWLKRISTIKNTNALSIFSNNVFALNGTKILWGNAQNNGGIKEDEIYNSTESIEPGYSLDDEASYFSTKQPYSAIAVNDDNLVSGNFCAYNSGGTLNLVNTIIKGLKPAIGTGYVYKSLPDGKLSYYTLSEINDFKIPDDSKYGVYYASFKYPVIERPFEVDSKFYIWNDIEVYMPENVDNIAEIRYRELAGRTELILYNGNLYNNAYGMSDESGNTISGVTISNIDLNHFNKSVKENVSGGTIDNLYLWGMDVETKNTDRDGNNSIDIKPAYIVENSKKYATGIENVKNAICSISEGYPSGSDAYPSLVKKYEQKLDYTDYFPHNIKYEYFKGRGFDITCYDKNGNKSIGNGKICYFNTGSTSSNDKLFYDSIGTNADYVYLNSGTKLLPCYRILCKYVESKVHTSLPGGLCFLTITYLTARKLQASFEYKDESGNTQTKAYVKDSNNRFNIKKILTELSDYSDYIKPIANKRLKCGDELWRNCIDADYVNYLVWVNDESNKKIDEASIVSSSTIDKFYYVEEYNNIKKIYPILLKDNVINDNITLNTYYVNQPHDGGTYSGLVLTYKIYENSDDTRDILEAENYNEALKKIQYYYNGNSSILSGITSDNKVKGSFFEIYVNKHSYKTGSTVTDGVYWEITYDLTVDIERASTEEKNEYFKDDIYFFISEKEKGVRLEVERIADGDYAPILYEDLRYKKRVKSVKQEYGDNIPSGITAILSGVIEDYSEVQYLKMDEPFKKLTVRTLSLSNSSTENVNYILSGGNSYEIEGNILNDSIFVYLGDERREMLQVDGTNHVRDYIVNSLTISASIKDTTEEFYLLKLVHNEPIYGLVEGTFYPNYGLVPKSRSGNTNVGNKGDRIPIINPFPIFNYQEKNARKVVIHVNNLSFSFSGYNSSAITINIPWLTSTNPNTSAVLKKIQVNSNIDYEYSWSEEGEDVLWTIEASGNSLNEVSFKFNENEDSILKANRYVFSKYVTDKKLTYIYDNRKKRTDEYTNQLKFKVGEGDLQKTLGTITVNRVPNLLLNLTNKLTTNRYQTTIGEKIDNGYYFDKAYLDVKISGTGFKNDKFEYDKIVPEGEYSIPFAFTGDTLNIDFDFIAKIEDDLDSDGSYDDITSGVSLAGYYVLFDGSKRVTIRDGNMIYPIKFKPNYEDNEHVTVVVNETEITLKNDLQITQGHFSSNYVTHPRKIPFRIKNMLFGVKPTIDVLYNSNTVINGNELQITYSGSSISSNSDNSFLLDFVVTNIEDVYDRYLYIVSDIEGIDDKFDEINSKSPEVVHTLHLDDAGNSNAFKVFIDKLIRPNGKGFVFLIKEGSE